MPTQLVTKLLAYKRHVLVMHHMSRVTMSHKGLNGGSAKISGCSHTLLHMLNTQAGDLAWHLTHSAHHHRSSSGPEAHGYSREPVVTAPHQHHPRALSMRCHPHTPHQPYPKTRPHPRPVNRMYRYVICMPNRQSQCYGHQRHC
jgi:hypothetical protein